MFLLALKLLGSELWVGRVGALSNYCMIALLLLLNLLI